MSTSPITLNTTGSAITIDGLASGLDTSSIIAALVSAEREPITRLTNEQTKLAGEQKQLQTFQTSLQQLSFAAAEFTLPSTFESAQTVTSSEPTRVSAAATSGAAVGGHELEVTQLANAAQRTFTFTSPTAEETITVDGKEFKLKAGASAKEVASTLNTTSGSGVYAAVMQNGSIIISSRETGSAGEVTVSGGATLTEVAGSAKAGLDAEYTIDGIAQTSASNIVTEAIAGVTLTFQALTTAGPVTIDVQPPSFSSTALEAQLQSFVKLYNSTVGAIEQQVTTRPPAKPTSATELATGTLFADGELTSVLDSMRHVMYEPIAGLPAEMSSPADIGLSTGAATGGGESSQASLEGHLSLNAAKLAEAVKSNPEAVEKMLQSWSASLQAAISTVAEPGGTLETRSNGDGAQITSLANQITNMNELVAEREHALRETYAKLEAVISQNSSQSSWLAQQSTSLTSSS